MANIRGIEFASEIYDLEDTSARDTATTASQTATQAGQTATTASETATQAKETAEGAKVQADVARDEIGDISALETTEKTDLVSAINEVATKDPLIIFTCGYYQKRIPVADEIYIDINQMSTLLGKSISSLAVGQGILLQGVAKREKAKAGIPFSIFLEKTASGFRKHEVLDGTDLMTFLPSTYKTINIANPNDTAVTLFLNVVGINASIINN